MAGESSEFWQFFRTRDAKFKLDAVTNGPGIFNRFGMIGKTDDYSLSIQTDGNLNASKCFLLFCWQSRQTNSMFSKGDLSSLMSVNFTIGWLG